MNKHLSYEQLSEILLSIKSSHIVVRQYCGEHEFNFDNDQQQLLLATLQQDQKQIEEALEHFNHNPANQGPAETWIQYVPDQELRDSIERILALKTPQFDELVAAIGEYYLVLATFIERIRDQTSSESLLEFLDNLQALETQNAKALSVRLTGLNDT